jgi:Immunoglobulin domain
MKRLQVLLIVVLTIALYGCGGSNAAPVVTTPTAPTVTTHPANQSVTAGQTATFSLVATGTAPLTYQWSKNGTAIAGATSSSYITPATVMADSGATFKATVTNSVGTVTSNAGTLTVNPAPATITTQPSSATVTLGQTATFNVVATGTAPLTYQWSKNGTAISGATATSYTTPATVAGDNGTTFTVSVTNAARTVTSSAATLTVNVPPAITAQPVNQTVVDGQTANFSVTATGTAPFTYQWRKNGTAIAGATASSYTTPATVIADSGATFSVAVTNVAGNVTSSVATLTVNPAAPAITTQPANQTVLDGQTATFSVTASGTAPLAYQWSKNGSAIGGATASSYTTPANVIADTGALFTVTVTNVAGNVTSSAATLTVNPVAPAITAQPANQTVLAGTTASFSVTATGTTPLSYQWKKNATAVAGATSSSYTTPATVLGDSGALFTVTVTNGGGNVTSSAATLTVNAPPAVGNQPANQTVLEGQTATFSVTAIGTAPFTYQWSKNGAAIGGATSSSYTTPATVLASDNGATFTVTITNAFGNVTSAAASLTVNAAPPSITGQPANQVVVAGNTATFSVTAIGTAPLSYQWSKGGVAIGGATSSTYTTPATTSADNGATFTVTVSNAAGNVTSNVATLTINVPPTISVQPANQTVLDGQTATFSVTASGTGVLSYQWSKNAVLIPGATSSSYTTPVTSPADSGSSFTVSITNTFGNVTSNAAILTVNAIAPSITTQPSNQTVTEGQTANFSVIASGTAPLSYQWKKGGVAIGGATGSFYTTPATSLADNGASFTVTVTNTAGNITSNAATLTVNALPPPPSITAQPANQTVTAGQTATFSVTATGAGVITYQWNKNGVAIGGANNPSYTTPPTANVDNGSLFTVTVSNLGGNVTSNPATLTVNANAFQVSGNINTINGGGGLAGVTVSINTTPVQTALTDNIGNFSFGAIPNGSYTLTPSISGPSSVFLPSTLPVTVSGAGIFNKNFQGELGFTVAGTVNYAGPLTGRIYLQLQGGSFCGGTTGTSIAAVGGAFTIHGVCPGVYTLSAWMDNVGHGTQNASNPTGSVAVTVGSVDVLGQTVTLNNPAAVDISASTTGLQLVSATSEGALAIVKAVKNVSGVETATSYTVQWSTDGTFATGVNSKQFPAITGSNGGGDPYIMSTANGLAGLSGTLFFRVKASNGTSSTGFTNYSGNPVTIAAPAGLNTVSGTVTFTGSATGPLYAGCFDQVTSKVYAVAIASPVSPAAYSVSGIPTGTNCFMFGIVDQNRSGVIDAGDFSNTDGNSAGLTVLANTTQNFTLPSANAIATLNTSHNRSVGQPGDFYNLNFQVRQAVKMAVGLQLTAGPNVLVPMDVDKNSTHGFNFFPTTGSVRPVVGDTYDFSTSYSDATSEVLHASVTTVLDSFVQSMSQTAGTAPTFTWTAPTTPPAGYTYQLSLNDQNGNTIWQVPGNNSNSNGLPNSITSLTWDADPTDATNHPSVPALTTGGNYNWMIMVVDASGNSTQLIKSFTP